MPLDGAMYKRKNIIKKRLYVDEGKWSEYKCLDEHFVDEMDRRV